MVECFVCGKLFDPSLAELRAWADKNQPYDPTDWVCNDCRRAMDALAELSGQQIADRYLVNHITPTQSRGIKTQKNPTEA